VLGAVGDDGGVRITTLGPLAVDGRPVRGDRLSAVVRELVGARGRSVSTAALVDAVWQGEPPDDAAGAVQALVSRVRRLGLPVVAGPGGYRVPAGEVQVDAVTVRTLVNRGREALAGGDVAAARRDADEARALFPEIPELAGGESARLFAAAAGLRAEAALAAGGPYEEADLRRLVARIPPDEPAAALLVKVLAAQGRDAEAIETIERLRADLADRYGTDPSPVIQQVHLALLRGELSARPKAVEGPRRAVAAGLPPAWRRAATALVGRDGDLAAVRAALAEVPLVTIVATGGAGKTRLAAEIARRAERPVRVVELAGLRSPDEVLPVLLAALGGGDVAGAPGLDRRLLSPRERLRAVAPELDGLLVLDNCEHVLEAAAEAVADLLAAAPPGLAVLATSRAPLGLVGELVHRLAMLPDAEAFDLLATRARAGGRTPSWPPGRAQQLCHRLDNLPLALELAAARLRHMPIDDVLAGLSDRFALLDDALRGLPERHASLWAMVDWSRELLAPGEQELLERLAVIPAPFTANLAAAVTAAGAQPVRHGLAMLVEQSLLRLDEDEGGVPRYRMLETVREYGEARLDAAGDRPKAMAGLVGWARELAVAVSADLIGPRQIEAFARCAADQENLIAALRWSIAQEDEPAAVDVAASLFQFWTVRGLHSEVTDWAESLLHTGDPAARTRSAIIVGRDSGRPLPHAERLAWMCILIGLNAGIAGPMRLNVLTRRALRTLFAQRPAEVSSRTTILGEALPALEAADPERGLKDAERLIAHPDPYVQGMGFFIRAASRENSGRADASAGDAEQAYRRFEAVGDHWGMGMAAQAVGHLDSRVADEVAGEWLRRSQHHLELVGAAQDARSIRVVLDVQLAMTGDAEAEARLHEVAVSDQYEETDVCQATLGLALLALRRGEPDQALAYGDATIVAAARFSSPRSSQMRILFQVTVAVIQLRVAEARPGAVGTAAAQARAVEMLRIARDDVLAGHDSQMIGAWAMGGAELAVFRGDLAVTRRLWALGMRAGATLSRLFPQGRGERLSAALGTEEDREPLLAATRGIPIVKVNAQISELMDDLLRPSSGTPAAPAA
jgi:predicted ATPase/DNA-binding SARP family transcriptional activator